MKRLLTHIFFCFSVLQLISFNSVYAQHQTLWSKTIGGSEADDGFSVLQTSDGGFIIAGRTTSFGAGNYDVWLVKTDATGDTLWTNTYGYFGYEEGKNIQATSDSGYIIVGSTMSVGGGGSDVWLIKTNASGDTLWTKTYGGSDDDAGESVQETSDGGYIITGYTKSFAAASYDLWLIKTNASGDTLWTKTYGGSGADVGESVKETIDGGYIIAGITLSSGAGAADAWLLKTDASGDTTWTRTYGGTDEERIYSIQQTADSGYIVCGYTKSFGAGSFDLWLIKTNASGDTIWTKTYGGVNGDVGLSLQKLSTGGYIVAGRTQSFGAGADDFWLLKINTSGDTTWTETFGGSNTDIATSVYETSDGGFIVCGFTYSSGAGYNDLWLIRISPEASSVLPGDLNIPEDFMLMQNYPNPFNPTTRITFGIPLKSNVVLKIFNSIGEEVVQLVNEGKPAGTYEVEFNANSLSSGVYFYRLQAGDFIQTKKMILLR